MSEIRAPGVDSERDIVKAVRVGKTNKYLGTVKVEMISDDARVSIMKSKRNLAYHHSEIERNLIIKNLK